MSTSPAILARILRVVGVWALLLTMVGLCRQSLGAGLSPQQRREVLAEAQQAYDRGVEVLRSRPDEAAEQFRLAAGRFQMLVDDGVANGRLFYDLGNAYLQAGDVGRAILEYREAERFIAGDDRLEGNLRYARSLRRDQIAPSGERALADALLSWHRATSLQARMWVFIITYFLFWLILILWLFRRPGFWRYVAGACAILWIACGVSLAVELSSLGEIHEGVILRDEVIVRKGNGDGFAPQFEQPLHGGVEFSVLERRGDWLSIELPDGKTGWIPAAAAGLID
jgi:tetratricopeptide (TPR) repeat protein